MNADAFELWLAQDAPQDARFELSAGMVVSMAPERMGHNRIKSALVRAFGDASEKLPCEPVADGMALRVDAATQREPDVMLRCGPRLNADATRCDDPVVVVEITSPATAEVDFRIKVDEYQRVPSVAHYLIFDTERRVVIHHARTAAGTAFLTTMRHGGALTLDPPGLVLDLDVLLAAGD